MARERVSVIIQSEIKDSWDIGQTLNTHGVYRRFERIRRNISSSELIFTMTNMNCFKVERIPKNNISYTRTDMPGEICEGCYFTTPGLNPNRERAKCMFLSEQK